MNKLYYIFILLTLTSFTFCENYKEEARAEDEKLTKLYDENESFYLHLEDSVKFLPEFENSLKKTATYMFLMDSLAKRIDIKDYGDIKLYNFYFKNYTQDREDNSLWAGENKHYFYFQYQLNGNTDYIELEDKGEISDIFKFYYDKAPYYLIVSFYYDEDTKENNGGVLRVLKNENNKLVLTDDLFPDKDMFNNVISLRMDDFAFDPESRIVSYNQEIFQDGELIEIGRETWELMPRH